MDLTATAPDTATPEEDRLSSPAPGLEDRIEQVLLFLIAALAATVLTGYRFGNSNHGITVPLLKRLMDPSLYPGDVMVATGDRFPTFFYRLLAAVLPSSDSVAPAFFGLYVLALLATFAGVYRLGRFFGGTGAGVLAVAFALPVRIGLAGEALYRVAFSHSHLASALTIWAIVWFLEGRRRLPLLALSFGAYNHILYSAYALVPMTLVVLAEWKRVGRRETLIRLGAAVVPLLPIVLWALATARPMTPEWLALLELRSSHHSFPSAFTRDLQTATMLLGLAALVVSRLDEERKRLVAAFFAGTALLFVVGTIFTEYVPWKAMLQLQPHRSWRFLQVILYGAIAAGVVRGWREGGGARLAAVTAAIVVGIPGLEPLLPLALLAMAFLAQPPPAPWARVLAGAALLFGTGWGGYPIDATAFVRQFGSRLISDLPLAAAGTVLIVLAGRDLVARQRRVVLGVATLSTLLWLVPTHYDFARRRFESGTFRDVQNWVRVNTARDSVLITPPRQSGFRVFSERTIVGEWKDGTQQYFDEEFVREWDRRMRALEQPRYWKLSNDELLSLAYDLRATHIVMPRRFRRDGLEELYVNGNFVVYATRPAPTVGES